MTTIDWTAALGEQLTWHWDAFVRPSLDGLGDDEYRWEPVPGCWSVRPRAEARSSHPRGAGAVVIDQATPSPRPAPFTTIAWRMAHLVGVFGARAAHQFDFDPTFADDATIPWSLSADGGLALLDRAYGAWTAGVRALDPDQLLRPCGPTEGPYAEHPLATLVLHINREALHHAAELMLLRDLYRARGATDDPVR